MRISNRQRCSSPVGRRVQWHPELRLSRHVDRQRLWAPSSRRLLPERSSRGRRQTIALDNRSSFPNVAKDRRATSSVETGKELIEGIASSRVAFRIHEHVPRPLVPLVEQAGVVWQHPARAISGRFQRKQPEPCGNSCPPMLPREGPLTVSTNPARRITSLFQHFRSVVVIQVGRNSPHMRYASDLQQFLQHIADAKLL